MQAPQTTMIDVQTAFRNARAVAQEALGGSLDDYSTEEMELDTYKGRRVWMITLGMPKKARGATPTAKLAQTMEELFGPPSDREYKTFIVDAETGEVIAMKLRLLTSP